MYHTHMHKQSCLPAPCIAPSIATHSRSRSPNAFAERRDLSARSFGLCAALPLAAALLPCHSSSRSIYVESRLHIRFLCLDSRPHAPVTRRNSTAIARAVPSLCCAQLQCRRRKHRESDRSWRSECGVIQGESEAERSAGLSTTDIC